MKTVVASALLVLFVLTSAETRAAAPAPMVRATEAAESNRAKFTIKRLLSETKPMRDALGRLSRQLDAASPRSMVSEQDLRTLEASTQSLNGFIPDIPPSLFSKQRMKEIAAGGRTGTLTGAAQEKRRLREALNQRTRELDSLRADRATLKTLVDEYRQQESAARTLSDKVGKHMMTPTVEIVARLTGRSVALSWADFELTVIPALAERVSAGERALQRIDKVVAATEQDLAGYREALTLTEWLFADGVPVPSGQSNQTAGLPDNTPAQVRAIEAAIVSNNETARAAAEKLQEEAARIREHNAKIDRFSTLLGVVQGAAGLKATSGGNGPTTQTTQSITIIFQDQTWQQRPPRPAAPDSIALPPKN